MAKQSPAEPEAPGPSAATRRKGRRRRKVWRGRGEAATGAAPKGPDMAAAARPRSPREFSSNWKALQELLKQKVNSSNESLSTCQTYTKKKHPLKAGNSQEVPAINGNRKMAKAKSTNKMDNGSAKVNPPLAKPKSKRVAMDKNSNGTKSGGKGCKEKKKSGNILKEKGDIKHKRRKAEEHAEQQPKELTRAVAMDCEMVGVGPKGEDSIVARVSIVNQFGKCIYDKYVKPTEEVTDYRTAVSGIRPENINTGEDFKTVQKEVADILNGRILVGHALRNDLKVLFLDHPKKKIRDTQRYKPFRQRVKNARPSLKLLCERLLNIQVQTSEHCSIQDAQAAMRLYTLEKKKWEAAVKNKSNNKNCKT
ncbi:RNA exonuclease 4 isoform X3 [Calonectris borealis]|uniref:RNA exonuclease 4 isoform X3 n=1 Tax=Calonectris borealis TaxID=1323832 RepID=UPI003F4C559C